jgi:DUF1680 family protein
LTLTRLPPSSIRLGGLLGERMRVNQRRLAEIDEAALLAPFARHEDDDLTFDRAWAGEHVGKFLDAACTSLAHSPDVFLREKVDRCATALSVAQAEDGYLGAYAPARRWSSWDVWVHKYCLIGLLSHHRLTGSGSALLAARRAADLLIATFGDGAGQRDISAVGMHLGMASTSVLEPICALYGLTSDARYVEFARHIVRSYERPGASRLMSSLLDHGEVHRTANGKSYEMLSNLVGMLDLYRLTADAGLLRAVLAAWNDIVRNQLYETGTVSAGEHFQQPGRLLYQHASNVGETCATVSWLQLNHRLLLLTGEARFGAEIERTVFNHLLAAQDPRTGGFCYYTGLAGEKEFSTALLCCVSSGPRAIASLPDLVWARDGDTVILNVIGAGSARFEQNGVAVTIEVASGHPCPAGAVMRIETGAAVHFVLRIRVPVGSADFEVRWNGNRRGGRAGDWVEIAGMWEGVSTLQLAMQLPVRAVRPKATGDCVILQRGAQVLAFDGACNPHVQTRHRIAIPPVQMPSVDAAPASAADCIEIDGRAGVQDHSGRYSYVPSRLRLIPFSRARAYSALLATRENTAPLALSAFERTAASHERPTDPREAVTDEDVATCRTAHAGDPSVASLLGLGHQDAARVWFAVRIAAPHRISRVVFRQGPISASGGWFDASLGKPMVEIVRHPLGTYYGFLPDFHRADWLALAPMAGYPLTSRNSPGALEPGQEFELVLTAPVLAHAVRIVGAPALDTVTCSGLAAYAPAQSTGRPADGVQEAAVSGKPMLAERSVGRASGCGS